MDRLNFLLPGLALVTVLAVGCSRKPAQTTEPEHPEAKIAQGMADAYARGNAKVYREQSTRQLLQLPQKSREELLASLDALVAVGDKRGMQGLEGAVSSTLATLARRDAEGAALARERLASLRKSYRVDRKLSRVHAYVPFKRSGSPVVFYLQTPIARAILEQQIKNGTLDADQALGQDLCTEAGLAAFELAWGAERANQLRELCNGMGSGAPGGEGGGRQPGIGPLGEASTLDCIGNHEPTRAERIEAMMQACLTSVVNGTNTGNPWATDGILTLQPLSSYRADGLHTRDHWERDGNFSWLSGTDYYEQPPPADNEPHNVGLVKEVSYDREGSKVSERNYDGPFEERKLASAIDYVDGEMVRGIAYDSDGNRTEAVDMTPDGGYIVTKYTDGRVSGSQRYDKDGNAVDEAGQPTTPDSASPGMEWGETPECRALSVGLLLERSEGELQRLTGDPTVNPDPNAPGEEPDGLDCLGLAEGPTLDTSFQCRDELKLCPLGQVVDASCACQPITSAVVPQQLCGIFAVCTSERQDDFPNDACCGDVFEDPTAGPGPQPLPVNRFRREDTQPPPGD